MNRQGRVIAFVLLAVVLVAVRFVGIGQYPRIHPDEGFWAGGPRNRVLFGDSLLDGRLHPYLSPGTFGMLTAYFQFVPPNLTTARAFSAGLGLLTCLLLALIARHHFPRRPWLLPLLFGLSSLAVLTQRTLLLEANQVFWLVLAAVCWLSERRGGSLFAGLAFGMALLVKSNSIFLLPAFLFCRRNVGRPWLGLGLFLIAAAMLGGGTYLAVWLHAPNEFVTAFRFELDGSHFDTDGSLFRVGRFGLNPRAALAALGQVFVTDGLLIVLALVGLAAVLRHWRSADLADRFFAVWLVSGAVFFLGQIYVTHRYLTTLAPALAFLAARAVAQLLDRPRMLIRATAACILVAFCIFNVGRVGWGAIHKNNADYWELVGWMNREMPADARVLASPVINLSLRRRSYDFYRGLVPYQGERRSLDDVVQQWQIACIVVDAEWRSYETTEMARFLKERCRLRHVVGDMAVYDVLPSQVACHLTRLGTCCFSELFDRIRLSA